ncbi:MAG: MATE family efflux transporter, partial [Myxococcales bacterium]|nr:MATE family efflux transporter [Myxococcales bacterium]
MPFSPDRRAERRATFQLAAPLVVAFAGNQLLSLVDTMVAGRLGAEAIAAVGLGGALFFLATVFPLGLLMGLDPVASQALGAGRPAEARTAYHEALVLAAVMAPLAAALALLVAPGA